MSLRYPTQDKIKKYFRYVDGGYLIWRRKARAANNVVGKRAGWYLSSGYRLVEFFTKTYYEHVLIFIYHHGFRPSMVDHKNRRKYDNRIVNLRACSRWQNCANAKLRNNASGVRGVYKQKNGKWCARIRHKTRMLHLGVYQTKAQASHIYTSTARKLRKEFSTT